MKNQRGFCLEFKRQVVEELLSGGSRPAQLCRRYNISSNVLYHWERQYSQGKFNNEPTEEAALKEKIETIICPLLVSLVSWGPRSMLVWRVQYTLRSDVNSGRHRFHRCL